MTMLELLSQAGQFDLALLPLIALALLPTLTASMGTVGGGLAATALGAGLGAAQGAIVAKATGGDPGKGAGIGAGTGALGAGVGSVAGAGASGAAAGAEAGTAGAEAGSAGLQVGTTAAPLTTGPTASLVPEAATQVGSGGVPEALKAGAGGFEAAQAAELGAEGADILGSSTSSFADSPVGALGGEVSGETLREASAGASVAGAPKGFDTVSLAKALGKAGTSFGTAASKGTPPGPIKHMTRRSLPNKVRGRGGMRQVDPVMALLGAVKQRQNRKLQERTFF